MAGEESVVLGDDASKNRLAELETRPGDATAEQAKVEAQIAAQTPKVEDGAIERGIRLSPQARRVLEEYHGKFGEDLTAEPLFANLPRDVKSDSKGLPGDADARYSEVLREGSAKSRNGLDSAGRRLGVSVVTTEGKTSLASTTFVGEGAGSPNIEIQISRDLPQYALGRTRGAPHSAVRLIDDVHLEELIHASDLTVLKDRWVAMKEESRGTFKNFVEADRRSIFNDIRTARESATGSAKDRIDGALETTWSLYFSKQPEAPQIQNTGELLLKMEQGMSPSINAVAFVAEFTRMLAQLDRGKLPTEVGFRTLIGRLSDWIGRSLNRLTGALEGAKQGELGNELRDRLAEIGQRLDRAGVGRLPPQAQSIYDQYGFVSPQLAASLASGSAGFATGIAQDPEGATAQERAIDRLKNGLVMGVIGVGGGYMLGRHFANPAPRPKVKAGSVLADVDKHLQPAPTPSLGSRIAAVPTQLRSALITRFAALDKLAKDVAKANPGTVLPEVPMSRKFEQIAGANGKAAQDVRDFEDAVVRKLAPTERHDFDRLLFLKRTGQRLQWNAWLAGEQARIAAIPPAARTPDEVRTFDITQDKSVADWRLSQVDDGLDELEQRLGKRRFTEIDQLAAGEFQQAMDRGLQLQVASGRISPAAYSAIKKGNDFYAPFRVLTAIEGHDGTRAGGAAIDTRTQVVRAIEGISDENFRLESPTVAAAENLVRGRVLADKNLKMLELARLADADKTGTLIRKLAPGQDARRGYETVNYFDQGEPMRLEVGPDVAKAIKGLNPAETGLVAGLLQRSGAVFRFGATTANVAFQARNLFFADQPRLLLVSKYGIQLDPRELWQVPTDFAHALYSSILGNVAGKETALYRKFYESGAAGATFQDAIDRISGRVGDTVLSRSAKGLGGIVDDVSAVTRVLEETTKLMGLKRGIRIEGVGKLSPAAAAKKMEEIVTEVRNFAGSPDFARYGTFARDANMVVTFFKARIQGTMSDLGRLGGADGGKAARDAWVRIGATAGVASAYFWYRNRTPENAADFERVPEWEKQTYLMAPRYDESGSPLYGTNPQGEKVREYWRIPKREGVKIVANMAESALDFARSKEPGAVGEFGVRLLEDVSPLNIAGNSGTERIESAIGNLTPALRLLYEVPSNRSAFRHRDVVPASRQGGADPTLQQFPGRTPELYVRAAEAAPTFLWDPLRSPLMLQHIVEGMTGGLVRQFTPNQVPQGERDPATAALAANPVGRVFVSSQQVGNEKEVRLAEESLRSSRDRSIALDNEAMTELDRLAKLAPPEKEARVLEIEGTRPELIDAMADEAEARAKNLTSADRLARRMPVRDGTRARYIVQRLDRTAIEKREAFLRDQMAKGILTDNVLDQVAELKGAGKN